MVLKERHGHYEDETLRKAMTVFDEKRGGPTNSDKVLSYDL